jgi:hypothetical protein
MTNSDSLISDQPSRDLLRTPFQTQLGFNHFPCFPNNASWPVIVPTERFAMGLFWSIASQATIATQGTAYGGFMAANFSAISVPL